MNRRQFLLTPAAAAAGRSTPPNIVFVMPDQWRGTDVAYAGNAQVRTPNLDRLAGESVQFVNTMANCPVCCPARATLLTGKYPHACGVPVNEAPLPSSETSVAEPLGQAGYYTGFVGKWHVQGGPRQPGFVPPGPRRQGFEYWAANICKHNYLRQDYFRDDPTPIPMNGYDAITWTDLAIEFLERAGKKPYCLYLQYPSPHNPYITPPGFEGMYDPAKIELRKNWRAGVKNGSREDIAGYYAAISCLDREIGRLLGKVGENTVVLFMSDHGDMLGSQGTFLKRKPWEESVRVPGLVRWPAAIKPRRSTAPFSHVDVVPTLLGLAGVRAPKGLHGFDYSGYLTGRSTRAPEMAHLMIYTRTEAGEFGPWRGVRTPRYKYARFQDRPWVLYDLDKDPFEMENLVATAAARDMVREFDGRIEAQMRSTGDRWDELEEPYKGPAA